jgi:hypothetical protein
VTLVTSHATTDESFFMLILSFLFAGILYDDYLGEIVFFRTHISRLKKLHRSRRILMDFSCY